ncbi:MAG TPA: CAP domain-containing protein, partial [Chloroflexota bacterium]
MLPVISGVAHADTASSSDSAVDELSRLRQLAGLSPVSLNPSNAAQLHAHYLTLNEDSPTIAGLNVHTERFGAPGYTSEGAAVAPRTNIAQGPSSADIAVRNLVDVPLHRHGMLAPALTSIGIGGDGDFWVFDLSSSGGRWRGQPRPVIYPADGQRNVPLAFLGNEVPNPLTAVPGLDPSAKVGYPITLDIWGCNPENVEANLSKGSQPVPIYLVEPGTVVTATGGTRTIDSVLLLPQRPLDPSTTYTPQVSASCAGLGTRTYTWSFTTHAALDPTGTRTAISADGADDWQHLAISLVDTAELAVAGAQIKRYEWSAATARGNTRHPEFRIQTSESGIDGRLRLDFRWGDALWIDLKILVAYDGQTAALPPLHLTPGGSGSTTPISPQAAAPPLPSPSPAAQLP